MKELTMAAFQLQPKILLVVCNYLVAAQVPAAE